MMLKKKLLYGIIAASVGIGLGGTTAFAYKTWYPGGFWPVPTTIVPYYDLTSESLVAIDNGCDQWNGVNPSGSVSTLVTRSSSTHTNTTYPKKNGKNEITKGARGTNNYLMETYASDWSPGQPINIYEADIDINTSVPWKNDGSTDAYDVGNVMTHELGHLLGLDHSTDSLATMRSGSTLGMIDKRTIEEDDEDGIENIYGGRN